MTVLCLTSPVSISWSQYICVMYGLNNFIVMLLETLTKQLLFDRKTDQNVHLCHKTHTGMFYILRIKKLSQYLCFLIKSTILDISLSNCMHELYNRNFTCIRLLCEK